MQNYDDFLMEVYESRENMVADRHRPRYHFLPPEGRWNDINGAIYWKGRYHIGYLQKIAIESGRMRSRIALARISFRLAIGICW